MKHTGASSRDGYLKWTSLNSISPVNVDGISPSLLNILIFETRWIIWNTYPADPDASANACILGIRVANENVAVKQQLNIYK
jgi:hypothetical protein